VEKMDKNDVKIADKKEWKKAQELERQYWNNQYHSWLKRPKFFEATGYYIKLFKRWLQHEKKVAIEIGCGPKGILPHVKAQKKIGIDPLMNEYIASGYKMLPEYETIYITGVGEAIPLRNQCADVVYCINVLDHAINPEALIKQIYSILKEQGLFILCTDLRDSKQTSRLHPTGVTAIINILRNPEYRIRMSEYSAQHVKQNLSLKNFGAAMKEVIIDTVKNNRNIVPASVHFSYDSKAMNLYLKTVYTALKEKY